MELYHIALNRQEFEMEDCKAYGQVKENRDPSDVSEVDKSVADQPCETTENVYEKIADNS